MKLTSVSIEGKQLNLCKGNIIFCHVDFFCLQGKIKGSKELTHGSACNGVWKLQSMNVLKLLSTNLKAD